jgi:hypothetical protein
MKSFRSATFLSDGNTEKLVGGFSPYPSEK